jgi:hypothetical protein
MLPMANEKPEKQVLNCMLNIPVSVFPGQARLHPSAMDRDNIRGYLDNLFINMCYMYKVVI